MLLRTLRLENFRQFVGEQAVQFAADPVKNVTVVMGENGSGKTTLAQAFTWCLYGTTDFDDKSVMNRIVERQIMPGSDAKVRVSLELTHGGIEYTVVREQVYRRDSIGKTKAQNTTVSIMYKKDGQQEFVKPLETENRIKQILPQELSRYFFFDGERIGNMSKEIRKGRSQEFAQAVRGLLGLNAFIAAVEHLKPTSKRSVIGSYNESYDSSSDIRVAQLSQQISDAQDRLDKIDVRLAETDLEVDASTGRCEELSNKLATMAESQRLQEEKSKLREQVDKLNKDRLTAISSMMRQFGGGAASFFARSLITNALVDLSAADMLDKGIPDMHARTIKFLMDRGMCVCGTKIEFNSAAYNELNNALKYLPPQSIGASISQFVRDAEVRAKASDALFEAISLAYKSIRDKESQADDELEKIDIIEKKLASTENAAGLQEDLWRHQRILSKLQTERDQLNIDKGSVQTVRDRAMTSLNELVLRDEKNRKIEAYKAYAAYLHEQILSVYKSNEDDTRRRLELYINETFRSIYSGEISLSIDEKYNIQVAVGYNGEASSDVETSTAQSISVIFAFISGIIRMARENGIDDNSDNRMLESEPYPLVMDAPLSSFDKRRIRAVCDVLPSVAEQVIIFIKDTDGELAEENLGARIGQKYLFDKANEFTTHLTAR